MDIDIDIDIDWNSLSPFDVVARGTRTCLVSFPFVSSTIVAGLVLSTVRQRLSCLFSSPTRGYRFVLLSIYLWIHLFVRHDIYGLIPFDNRQSTIDTFHVSRRRETRKKEREQLTRYVRYGTTTVLVLVHSSESIDLRFSLAHSQSWRAVVYGRVRVQVQVRYEYEYGTRTRTGRAILKMVKTKHRSTARTY